MAAHAKLNKFSGISFLASNKLEETMHESEDSIMTDLNKIIQNSSYVLSQNNLQILLKDIDHLLENNSLNSEYIKEFNDLEINLASKFFCLILEYLEGLQLEMEGKLEEAKDIYKQNNLFNDITRIDKLIKEFENQMPEDSIIEFNDIYII
jgi:hypothetical protein